MSDRRRCPFLTIIIISVVSYLETIYQLCHGRGRYQFGPGLNNLAAILAALKAEESGASIPARMSS